MNTDYQQIDIINVFKKYKSILVFQDYNLIINNDIINLFIGPNGKGKSTLIKMILGLTSYKGKIKHNLKNISYAPEKIILPDYIKVQNFLELMNINLEKAKRLVDKFNLNINKTINQLSKGMRQKLLLIQALSKEADAYFFDEPLNGLDDDSIENFISEIDTLFKLDKLIVISTHLINNFENLPLNIIRVGNSE